MNRGSWEGGGKNTQRGLEGTEDLLVLRVDVEDFDGGTGSVGGGATGANLPEGAFAEQRALLVVPSERAHLAIALALRVAHTIAHRESTGPDECWNREQ